MSDTCLVGIDDTDNPDSIGTGRLARMLAEHLEVNGLLTGTSVTRHQFLVHPDIPYTSHNSSACIAGSPGTDPRAIADATDTFLRAHFQTGSNPGLCVCRSGGVPSSLVDLARRAQQEVLGLDEFDRAVAGADLELRWAGPTGQGRIGATSGVALRSTGADGRFIALRGIRELEGTLEVAEIVSRSDVAWVEDEHGTKLGGDVAIETRDWVRPTLRGGRPVLRVRRDGPCWVPAEKRKKAS